MTTTAISPLRARMIEDMRVRNFAEKTGNDYIRNVATFAAFLNRSPDTATEEGLRRSTSPRPAYQVGNGQVSEARKVSPASTSPVTGARPR